MKNNSAVLVVVVAAALSACGSNGSDAPAPAQPSNTAPQIMGLANQSIDQDTSTGPLAFSVSDAQSGSAPLQVSATSSDTTLVPAGGVVVGGSGASRTIEITPAEDATGAATIAVTATDPQGAAVTSNFTLTVRAVQASITAFTNTAYALGESDLPVAVRGLTFVQDADDPGAFDGLLQ